MLPLLLLGNAGIASVLLLVLVLFGVDGAEDLVVHLAGLAQSFLVYRENCGPGRRGWWADKGCAYLGIVWLFGAYLRRHRWWSLPRFLLVLAAIVGAEALVLGVARLGP